MSLVIFSRPLHWYLPVSVTFTQLKYYSFVADTSTCLSWLVNWSLTSAVIIRSLSCTYQRHTKNSKGSFSCTKPSLWLTSLIGTTGIGTKSRQHTHRGRTRNLLCVSTELHLHSPATWTFSHYRDSLRLKMTFTQSSDIISLSPHSLFYTYCKVDKS